MHKRINNHIPSKFSDLIKRLDYKYPTDFHSQFFTV